MESYKKTYIYNICWKEESFPTPVEGILLGKRTCIPAPS